MRTLFFEEEQEMTIATQTSSNLDVTTPGDREIRITRVFQAPRSLVFDAYTKPHLVRRWMLGPPGWTLPVCEIDLRVGGAIRYVWHGPDGTEMGMSGRFREIAPPERIVHTELFDQDWTGGETEVTTALAEQGGRTTVTMSILYVSAAARKAALATGMTDGMSQSFAKLDDLLAEFGEGAKGAA
jgi:uncharacterized protein YndB with AHSA1/START domain